MSYFRAKMHHIQFCLGPPLSAPPDLLAGGKEVEGEGEDGNKGKTEGEGGRRGEEG